MITTDKKISTAKYWDAFYTGKNTGTQDNSNTVRSPQPTVDRFQIVVDLVEGKSILDVGSGHARIAKMIKAKLPNAYVLASDQSPEAKKAANYHPYIVCTAYQIPTPDKYFDVVIATQMLEYLEDNDRFFQEAKRVGKSLVITVPLKEMSKWSQLHIYTEESVKEMLSKYGEMVVMKNYEDLLLVKVVFND